MIPRHQKVLVVILLLASVAMGATLWRLRERAHQRLLLGQNSAPTQAPEVAPAEQVTHLVANDSDGTLLTQARALPLPPDPGARARVILGSLLDLYATPDAAHPVSGGAAGTAVRCCLREDQRDGSREKKTVIPARKIDSKRPESFKLPPERSL